MEAYAGAARRRVHLATVFFGLRPSPNQAARPAMPVSLRRLHRRNQETCGRTLVMVSNADLDKKGSDGRDSPQGVSPDAHRCVVAAYELCR